MKKSIPVMIVIMIAAIPFCSFATDGDIVKTAAGYIVDTGETIPLYRVRIPSDTEEIDLAFDDAVAPVREAADGEDVPYCDTDRGIYDVTAAYDGDGDGTADTIVIYDPYTDEQPGDARYAITFKRVKTYLEKTSYVYNGKVKRPALKGLKPTGDITYLRNRISGGAIAAAKFSGSNGIFGYSIDREYPFKIKPRKTYIKRLRGYRHSVSVKWFVIRKQCSGYQIRVATDSGFSGNVTTVTLKGLSKSLKKVTGLKRHTKYYVKVRSYKNAIDGNTYYSSWSKVKTCKTK